MAEGLPGTAGTVFLIKPAGDLIEIYLGLLTALLEHALEIAAVLFVFPSFAGYLPGQFKAFVGLTGGLWIDAVQRALAVFSKREQAVFLKHTKMG